MLINEIRNIIGHLENNIINEDELYYKDAYGKDLVGLRYSDSFYKKFYDNTIIIFKNESSITPLDLSKPYVIRLKKNIPVICNFNYLKKLLRNHF